MNKTAAQIRAELASRSAYPRTQKDLARQLGVSVSYLNECIKGRRELGPLVLSALGYERVVTYLRTRRSK